MKKDMIKAITINYNLTRKLIKEGFLTKEEGIEAYKKYAESIHQVYSIDETFQRWNNLHMEKLKEM